MTWTSPPAAAARQSVVGTTAPGPQRRVEEALDTIAALEPLVNAWAHLAPEQAREAALSLEAEPAVRSPLHGLPLAVKDIIDVAGMPTCCGDPLRRGEAASADAASVSGLRRAGAIPLGKTVTTPFAFLDPGPTRNPHDVRRTPGGSSSGSAAAVAAGMVPIALGTQTGGSTIVPASFCGVWALRIGLGRTDLAGVWRVSPSFDTLGLFARSLELLAALADVLLPHESSPPLSSAPRIVVARTGLEDGLDRAARHVIADAESALRRRGASVSTVDLRGAIDALAHAHGRIAAHETAVTLAADPEVDMRRLPPRIRSLVQRGRELTAGDLRSEHARLAAACLDVAERVGDADAVLAPAVAGVAPVGDLAPHDSRHVRPLSALGWPIVAVPFGHGEDGLPIAVQMLGPPGSERRLLAVAQWLHGGA